MKASVLIIEQHRHHAEEIYRDIHELFEHYHIAITAEEAMIYINDHDFDMIIINPFLPDRAGRAFIHDLKDIKKLDLTPIIVISDLPASRVKLDFYSVGADVYLELPYDKIKFKTRIREELLRHFQVLSNNGRDKGSEFITRDEFEMHFENSQLRVGENKKTIVGLIAPAGMYYVIRDYGLEVGIKLITALSQLMKKMCSDKLKAAIWTQKSIVFLIEDLSEDIIVRSLNEIRKEYLERFSDIDKLQRTPGIRAVLTNLSADKGLHETIDKLSSQLFQLSKMTDSQPIQFYGSSVSLRRRIMIADPDPIAINVITHRLKKDGYDPVIIQEISELLKDHGATDIAGILVDSMVPEGGVNMIKAIHAQPDMANIPIMLFSRYGFEDEIAAAFNAGAQDYMMKPLSMVELSARMKRLTG